MKTKDNSKKHQGGIRGFTQLSRAWYGKSCMAARPNDFVDEVTFGFYDDDGAGGTTGEMSVKWCKLSGKIVPELLVFDDAWHALYEFKDVLAELAEVDDKNITPAQFCAILTVCGFKDLTKEKSPYAD